MLKTRAGAVIGTNLEPIAVDIAGAVRATGLGRTKIYELLGNGELRSVKIGRRRVITLDALREMLAAYEANNVGAAT